MSFRTVSVFGARFAFAEGRLPWRWSRRGPWGVAVAPPISPYTGPGWSPPFCRVPLVPRSVFYVYCATFRPYSWRSFGQFHWLLRVPVPPMRGCSLDTCVACTWLDLMSSSALFQDSVICADFWSRQYGPHTACDRLRWRWPCLPRLRWFDPLLLRCAWWSSGPGWLLNLYLAGTYVGAFLYWTLVVLEAGLTSRPLLALPRLCLLHGL